MAVLNSFLTGEISSILIDAVFTLIKISAYPSIFSNKSENLQFAFNFLIIIFSALGSSTIRSKIIAFLTLLLPRAKLQ
ncbi:hypothetical protein BBG19_0465 [Francisella sp. MA067296]|nr:hypothetical protein BBG19_0465 [Francisella sp. MA067296]